MTDPDLAQLAELEARAEAIWAAGPRKFEVGRADHVQRENPHACKWAGFGGLPVCVNLPPDPRTKYSEGSFGGKRVRDYGDGTYATWKHGIRLAHDKRSSDHITGETGARRD